MCGEKLVVKVSAEKVIFRPRELNSHHQRENPCEQKESESGNDIAPAYVFVIGRHQPAGKTARRSPNAIELFRVRFLEPLFRKLRRRGSQSRALPGFIHVTVSSQRL